MSKHIFEQILAWEGHGNGWVVDYCKPRGNQESSGTMQSWTPMEGAVESTWNRLGSPGVDRYNTGQPVVVGFQISSGRFCFTVCS